MDTNIVSVFTQTNCVLARRAVPLEYCVITLLLDLPDRIKYIFPGRRCIGDLHKFTGQNEVLARKIPTPITFKNEKTFKILGTHAPMLHPSTSKLSIS
ncbi:hypothetical protein OUZ56_025339 [Daphnia magna]|uniref:GMP synthase n=1 Tax=Daphnia magna TaxID=35525 RepID=A0ABQ9ZJJ4_9CRUS|nr:hypothetical protein OUZ56_025339 [Daphnia magna]